MTDAAAPSPTQPESFLAFAGMKDEGAFLLEWVAWYRMLGFDVMVGVNDCTDHSPQLLNLLQDAGWLTWFEHVPRPKLPPKNSAHAAMRDRPETARTDWLMICDVDEFLVLHRGDGTIQSFMDDIGGTGAGYTGAVRDFMGMAFHWRCFGTSGWQRYRDGFVHRQFKRCGAAGHNVNATFKMLFRDPLRFRHYSDHSPYNFDGDWTAPENRIVDCEGRTIPRFLTAPHPIRFTSKEEITHATAQMNHYVIRSDESFDLKRGKPSASAGKDRYTDMFYKARNRNGHRDLSAQSYGPVFDAVYAEIAAVPGAMRLHHLCCADYVRRLCDNAGTVAEDDKRWIMHMDAAARLNG